MKNMKKIKLKIYKLLNQDARKEISSIERYVIMTAYRLMSDPQAELLIHPSRERYYI